MIIQKLSIFVAFGGENCGNMQNTLKIDDLLSQYIFGNIYAMNTWIFMKNHNHCGDICKTILAFFNP